MMGEIHVILCCAHTFHVELYFRPAAPASRHATPPHCPTAPQTTIYHHMASRVRGVVLPVPRRCRWLIRLRYLYPPLTYLSPESVSEEQG